MSLRRMVLHDFVIVQSLELDLSHGFSVLTGETGAGKSILIDALQLVLGARAESSIVRQGALRCEIAAEFDTPPALVPWLEQHGFASEDSLLLRRTVDTDGRSRAWVNASAATVGQLKALAHSLVDIHGQHAWQSLARPQAVRALLDAYAGADTTLARQHWTQWQHQRHALHKAAERQNSLQQDSERLIWQIAELDKLAPAPGQWEELNAQHSRLAHAQALLDAGHTALAALHSQEPSAHTLIERAVAALQSQAHIETQFAQAIPALQSALLSVQDTVHGLRQYTRHTEPDPSTLQSLDARLAQWLSMARRYRCAPPDLPQLHAQWKKDLAQIDQALDLAALQRAERHARQTFTQTIQTLSQQRQRAAPTLAQAVTASMQTLGMQGARFEVNLRPLDEPQAEGGEQVEFLVAGHASATARPVAKVASGGELSRIALAISVVTSQLGVAPTLIFDEVDSGIGGTVAHTVGQLLRQLGADRQVLAVTHLPQVAARANHHLLVSKQQTHDHTLSSVRTLSEPERVGELARMLGGSHTSAASMAHARELLRT